MGEQKRVQVWVAFLLIGMLLAASWPAAVQSQGPEEAVARFREARLREPEGVPLVPEAVAKGVSPEGLHLWQTERVEGSCQATWEGKYSSLALDAAGRPHISYYDGYNADLKYAYFDGISWHLETVDSTWYIVGEYTSLALDAAGHPHISYYDSYNADLKYAYFDGTSWRIEAVDGTGDVGQYTSLALDAAGHPHISYYDWYNADLKYAYFDGTSWHIKTVDSEGSVGRYTSIALDAAGHPHVSYSGDTGLKYARYDGTSWHIETVDNEGDGHTSLALDAAGHPHISYYDWANADLKYAYFDGISWHLETVDGAESVGEYTSLALDAAGHPHIGYHDATNYDLKYAYFDGTSWHIETVDSEENVGQYTSLALDVTGHPHISYYDATNYDLKYAYFDGTPWHLETVSAKEVGYYTSLALDAAGHPHISYYDQSRGNLKYAYFDRSTWHLETVDRAGDVGEYTSLALDAAGHPHISYYDVTNYDLKYAYFDGTSWHIETVDSEGGVGIFASLALDVAGHPHISYYDWTNYDLKYARYDGTSWHIETVDSTGYVGLYTSLAVDTTGHPHISYFDGTNYDLKYAYFDGTSWHIETVDSAGWVGEYTSLALDAAAHPHISYYDDTNYDLKYAYFDGTSWHIETVDSTESVGRYTSLALDAAGHPHISYHDNLNEDLRYAYFDGASWHIETADGAGIAGRHTSLALDDAGRPHVSYYDGLYCSLKYARKVGNLADWSRLVFASYRNMNWEIYAARGDGAYPARLTANNKVDSRPEFNRGATQIAFYSNRDGNYEIYKMNADGSAQTRLTWTSFPESQPSWSPDGSRIVYYGYPDTQTNAEIYVMNADGSGQTRLTWDPAWDGHPTWSPDGSRILFASNRSGNYELWTMAPDGTDLRQLTYGMNYATYPDWSPDGSRIAFNDDYNNDGWFDLAVINADGTGLVHPLDGTPYSYDRLAPAWAPHGNDLAFAQIQYIYYQGNWYWVDAYIYGLDLSSNATYLLVDSGYDWWPDWQPTDLWPPTSQMAPLPTWSGTTFTVSWSGSDSGGAGLRSYDVQYRDGAAGSWTDWLLDTPQISATFFGEDGHTYYFRCRARDYAFNVEPYPEDYEAFTTVDVTPPTSAASSPGYASALTFPVSWSGSDATSGIASYDIQVRDGSGSWTNWMVETAETSALFVGEPGHTYYFQSRARDRAGNLEAYPGGDGDTHTHTPQYTLGGYIWNIREEPVALARVEASPPALNSALSRNDGAFTLYFNLTGTYALSVTRSGFGALPPMQGVSVPAVETPFFYLPPLDDVVADGDFEAGDLSGWNLAGEIPPTLAAPGHTGDWAATLGGNVPSPVVTPTVPFMVSAVLTASGGVLTSSLATLEVPPGAVSGTAVFTLSGVPTVTGIPEQDVGLHLSWAAALTDGTPFTATLLPLTLTVRYSDAAWQAAQVAGEETLHLWRYDPVSATWTVLTTTLDVVSNTAVVTTALPGLYALAGAPDAGPWGSRLVQEVALPAGGTLSLLYRVVGAEVPTDTLRVVLSGPTQTLTYTLALTESGWVHRFWDLPAGLGPTATLSLEWLQGGRERLGVLLDEVSLGTAVVGGYSIYLPLVLR